ncbi:hypothetical protein [Polaribacter sp. M15]|jgi:hypothetical protein
MKNLTYILVLFVSVSFFSCGDDSSSVPTFVLSSANVTGTYGISSYEKLIVESATSTSGENTTELERNSKVGDRFQMTIILNTDGTYTANGLHGFVSTISPTPQSGQPNPETIQVDAAGTFTVNSSANTITFSQTKGDFILGTFNITTFSENSLVMFQEVVDNQSVGISLKTTTGIALSRQ